MDKYLKYRNVTVERSSRDTDINGSDVIIIALEANPSTYITRLLPCDAEALYRELGKALKEDK